MRCVQNGGFSFQAKRRASLRSDAEDQRHLIEEATNPVANCHWLRNFYCCDCWRRSPGHLQLCEMAVARSRQTEDFAEDLRGRSEIPRCREVLAISRRISENAFGKRRAGK